MIVPTPDEVLQFIVNGGTVRRYHTLPTLMNQSVGEHSANVALFTWHILGPCTAHPIMAALVHDLPEQVFGDIPSPVKKMLNLDEAEQHALTEINLAFALSPAEHWAVRFADALDGLIFALREFNMGNRRFIEVRDNYKNMLERLLDDLYIPKEIRQRANLLYRAAWESYE